MTEQSPETAQFFLTAAMPCPYLPDRQERKLFTHLSGRRAAALHHLLGGHGFRRSQNLIYRPACEGCNACQSVRVVAHGFSPRSRHRRNLRLNADIVAEVLPARASAEQYGLFRRYLDARHPSGGMQQMSFVDFEYMVEDTPVQTMVVEYRLRGRGDDAGELVGVALSDVMPDGLSMVYSFYEPALERRGLGSFMILDHIAQVRASARANGQGYVYLGYWVKDSPKMAYKAGFSPLEVQGGALGWQPLDPAAS